MFKFFIIIHLKDGKTHRPHTGYTQRKDAQAVANFLVRKLGATHAVVRQERVHAPKSKARTQSSR